MQTEYFSQEGIEQTIEMLMQRIQKKERGGFNAMLSPRLVSADWEKKSCTLAFRAEEWTSNPVGIVHGGILCAAADLSMGTLSIYLAQGSGITPSVSISIHYLRAVPLGEEFLVTVMADHIGRRINQLSCTIAASSAPHIPCVTAIGTYYVSELSQ